MGIIVPNVSNDDGALRNAVSAVLVLFNRAVGDAERDDRPPAQKLLDERTDVRERVFVCELWKTGGTNDGVELRLSPLLHIWVSGHCEEEGLDGR